MGSQPCSPPSNLQSTPVVETKCSETHGNKQLKNIFFLTTNHPSHQTTFCRHPSAWQSSLPALLLPPLPTLAVVGGVGTDGAGGDAGGLSKGLGAGGVGGVGGMVLRFLAEGSSPPFFPLAGAGAAGASSTSFIC